tara:strand:- start:161 stop:337 length:177 start_codon:yes stop_codon:yes gene_type:complete
MSKYDLTLILSDTPELTDELADTLFEAGCDDGLPGTCNGVFREAESLEKAISTVIEDV